MQISGIGTISPFGITRLRLSIQTGTRSISGRDVAGRFPYKKWLDKNVFEMHELEPAAPLPAPH